MNLDFTTAEKAFLRDFINGLYAEPHFSDVTVSDFVSEERNSNQVRGIISSLTKKGVVWSDDEYRISTDSGEMDGEVIIYLDSDYFPLHKEWAEYEGLDFVEVAGINA